MAGTHQQRTNPLRHPTPVRIGQSQAEERGLTDELAARYGDLRRDLPAFLRLPFEAAAGSEALLAAVEVARQLDAGGPEKLLDAAPRHFVPGAWRKAAFPGGSRPRRALWEIALALAMRDALRSGDLFLPASRRHVAFWNLVMGERQWAKADAYAQLGIAPVRWTPMTLLREVFAYAQDPSPVFT